MHFLSAFIYLINFTGKSLSLHFNAQKTPCFSGVCARPLRNYVTGRFVCEGWARDRKSASADQANQPLNCSYSQASKEHRTAANHHGRVYDQHRDIEGGKNTNDTSERTVRLIDVFDVNNKRQRKCLRGRAGK